MIIYTEAKGKSLIESGAECSESRTLGSNWEGRTIICPLDPTKSAVQENWRCNLTGVLVKALKEGVPSEDAAPPCAFFGWKEWADEAVKRRLMQYLHSQDGDIMVHFIGGDQGLWSRLRSLSWSEVGLVARGENL